MKYLLWSAIFASSTTHALPINLLKLDQYSGHVIPQAAMEAHCTFDTSLHLVSKILKDRSGNDGSWKVETNSDNIRTEAEFNQVQTWIQEAAVGPFKKGVTPCDVGTIKIVTEHYPLLVSQDCGKRVDNTHPSALKLIAWFRQACGLEGKKQ